MSDRHIQSTNINETDTVIYIDDDNVENQSNNSVSLTDLEQYGHCLSDVSVGPSRISLAGKGLFARKAFKKGEVVTISPVLTLRREMSDVTLFPLTNAAFINHAFDHTENLRMTWYDWSSLNATGSYFEHLSGDNALNLTSKLSQLPSELFKAPFAYFDLAYYATRDIHPGEELTVNYGKEWEEKWREYVVNSGLSDVNSSNNFNGVNRKMHRDWSANDEDTCNSGDNDGSGEESCTKNSNDADSDEVPPVQFREYMEAPEGMFPEHWMR
eukprot:gene26292-32854_t